MDRTYPCGGYDVGSIPAGSTGIEKVGITPDFFYTLNVLPAGIELRAAGSDERP